MDTIGFYPMAYILIVNSFLALIMFIYGLTRAKGKKTTYFFLSLLVLFVPLIGIIILSISFLIVYVVRKNNPDISEISFSQDREENILSPNVETEINYVSINEAIAISDTESMRNLLMNILLDGSKDKISKIAVAMESEDSETSHYAATMIMSMLSQFQETVQVLTENLQKFPEDTQLNLLAFDYIYDIISLGIMSDIEQKAYIHTLNNVAENLFENNLWYMSAEYYLKMTDLFISIKDFNEAKRWSERANKYRANELDTYKTKLHLYYNQHDNIAFFDCLDKLKNSDIIVDKEIMDLFHIYY